MLSSLQSSCIVFPLPSVRENWVVADQLGKMLIALFIFISTPACFVSIKDRN